MVQAGIQKNWFGFGNTSLYGEYGKATDWGAKLRVATSTAQRHLPVCRCGPERGLHRRTRRLHDVSTA